jgi:uncharacterized protein involved in exopolysaccharide biosynthesis
VQSGPLIRSSNEAVALLASSAWLKTATPRYTVTTQILLDPKL